MNKKLQVENGNFTRIINPLIDSLIQIPFNGCELQVVLFIIRKTYGYNKKQDEISLTQFEKGINRTKPVIVKALKNLQLVKVVKLVKRGNSKNSSNLWEINKYVDTWKLVNIPKLVKHRRSTSKVEGSQLVKAPKHTKDNTKDNTKDMELWNFNSFKEHAINKGFDDIGFKLEWDKMVNWVENNKMPKNIKNFWLNWIKKSPKDPDAERNNKQKYINKNGLLDKSYYDKFKI